MVQGGMVQGGMVQGGKVRHQVTPDPPCWSRVIPSSEHCPSPAHPLSTTCTPGSGPGGAALAPHFDFDEVPLLCVAAPMPSIPVPSLGDLHHDGWGMVDGP